MLHSHLLRLHKPSNAHLPDTIPDEDIELTCRVHDECNGSDVFGSDICTCRPYLTHAIEECIKTARKFSMICVLEGDMFRSILNLCFSLTIHRKGRLRCSDLLS